jgi:putative ABC transport system substrate-binding protein
MPLAAQQTEQRPILAVLSPQSADYAEYPEETPSVIIRRLAELGDVNGKNVDIQFRFADRDYLRLPKLAADLVALKPAVIYTWTTPGGRAAVGATQTIPIVIAPVSAVTMHALVPDFAHPGGNVTGGHITGKEDYEKCLQLLKEAVPSVSRVGVLFNPQNQVWKGYPEALADAAQPLGIELVAGRASGRADIDQAFADMAAKSVNGLFVLGDATLVDDGPTKARILELLASNRLPSVSDASNFTEDGGLLSMSADDQTTNRVAAEYIHRILQGAKPSELPVVSPKLLISVNRATAAKLGITIPQKVIARAEKVIR